MIYEKILLCPDKPHVTLEYFGNALPGGPRDAMLVIPGGGYRDVCIDREGYPIAEAYLTRGLQCFVLHYSTMDQITHYTQPLEEAAAAMIWIREHAEKYGLSGRVFTVGFSAGGHLSAWLATMWKCDALKALYPDKYSLCRPDGSVLCYAVIREYRKNIKETSFSRLYNKEDLTQEELDSVSLDLHVDADTCPVFIMHTCDDGRVNVKNALAMAFACENAGVPFEMHVYPHGPHGVALANDITWCGNADYADPQIARWVGDSVYWFNHHIKH